MCIKRFDNFYTPSSVIKLVPNARTKRLLPKLNFVRKMPTHVIHKYDVFVFYFSNAGLEKINSCLKIFQIKPSPNNIQLLNLSLSPDVWILKCSLSFVPPCSDTITPVSAMSVHTQVCAGTIILPPPHTLTPYTPMLKGDKKRAYFPLYIMGSRDQNFEDPRHLSRDIRKTNMIH